jgi:leucyl aminopeptidase
MNFELKSLTLSSAAQLSCDALIVVVFEPFVPAADALSSLIGEAIKSGDWQAKPGKLLQLYRSSAVKAPRLLLAGAGDSSPKNVSKAVHAAVAAIKGVAIKRIVVCFTQAASGPAVQAAVRAVADASYVYTTTLSKKEGRLIERCVLGVLDRGAVVKGFEQAQAAVLGIELAKEWGNRPANHATPTLLAQAAKDLAKLPGIQCEVLGPKEVAKLGMGSFMAVARGSVEPLRFVVLRYQGGAKTQAPVVLVGKGITFDTGGISIKPAGEMDEMKFDMCGAASVLGTFRALAQLKPAINVVGLIPSCENMPAGNAVKPGDVVTSMSGQTIEVLNTDAEGRLILCDALTYAERFKPRAVIDIATLTGACVVALGAVRSGLFSTDEALANALAQAGDAALDLCWRMPLDDEYSEGLKSKFADIANVAGRAGGAVTAAKFLQKFAGQFPWAHIDIAGTAWKSGSSKGSTGRPVGLLLAYLLAQEIGPAVAKAVAKPRTPKARAR